MRLLWQTCHLKIRNKNTFCCINMSKIPFIMFYNFKCTSVLKKPLVVRQSVSKNIIIFLKLLCSNYEVETLWYKIREYFNIIVCETGYSTVHTRQDDLLVHQPAGLFFHLRNGSNHESQRRLCRLHCVSLVRHSAAVWKLCLLNKNF